MRAILRDGEVELRQSSDSDSDTNGFSTSRNSDTQDTNDITSEDAF